ncbi:MAG: hypothetical protein M1840_002327 [Geoglossum simile]|nr:MAG: hypothetical protein M1840_002327 [Geoglossum simile]
MPCTEPHPQTSICHSTHITKFSACKYAHSESISQPPHISQYAKKPSIRIITKDINKFDTSDDTSKDAGKNTGGDIRGDASEDAEENASGDIKKDAKGDEEVDEDKDNALNIIDNNLKEKEKSIMKYPSI